MENPDQTILHVNSHGDKAVFMTPADSNNRFGNYVRAPIKNVNKIGLLYACIPKVMDLLHAGNNRFDIRISYGDNHNVRISAAPL